MKELDNWRICAIFAPLAASDSINTIASTLHLLEPLARQIFAITGDFPESAVTSEKIQIINVKSTGSTNQSMLVRVPGFIILQLKMTYRLVQIASKIDVVFLAAGASTLLLPALVAKLMRKRIVFLRAGTDSLRKTTEITYQKTLFSMGKRVFPPITGVLERLNYKLSDKIIVFRSDITVKVLERYRNKLLLSGSRFYVDVTSFKVEQDLGKRKNIIGYIGRFEEIKGVMNFVKAIPLVSREAIASFLIGGDGSLRDEIKKQIKDANLGDKVVLTGWIPYHKLPQYLNRIKLLVIPSYTEVGPNLLFEAMACATPVLSWPIGVIPDVIRDGKTGFIMEDNSPECIAQNIIRALNHPNLDKIARNARELIEREYTHEAAVDRYRSILASLR